MPSVVKYVTEVKLYKFYNYLFWHYIVLEMSTSEIAEKNGVNYSTIRNWLMKFGISIRTLKEVRRIPKVKENYSKAMKDVWNRLEYRKKMTGKNHPMFGKHHSKETKKKMSEARKGIFIGEKAPMFGRKGNKNPMWGKRGKETGIFGKTGDKHPTFKENAGNNQKHIWIRIHFPPKKICDNKCEICDKINLGLELARFRHINVRRNMENPMIDYMYICPKARKGENCKNNCHTIYDKLTDKQKEELLNGTTTRKEKLKRIRGYILKEKI